MFGRNRKVNTETEQPVQVENVSTAKKVFNIVKTVFTWIVVVFAVGMMIFTIISTTTLNRNDRSLFGYKMFIVLSDSMSISEQDTTAEDREGVHFNAGDLIFSKELDNEGLAQLQAGDVITFQSQGGDNFGEVVTHKIREVTRTAEGKLGFVTYGINTNTNDETIVDSDFVLGKYSGKIAKLGKFLEFQKSTVGYIVCIFVPFVILIILQGIKSIRLFRAYKKEQHAEMDAEKAEIAAQKAETEKMMFLPRPRSRKKARSFGISWVRNARYSGESEGTSQPKMRRSLPSTSAMIFGVALAPHWVKACAMAKWVIPALRAVST